MYTDTIGLFSSTDEPMVLKGVAVEAEILNTLADVTIVQSFHNEEKESIEAVYTFPLPLDAVLMDLTVTLGEKKLQGTVTAKEEAEESYEEAITDGDTAVMLEQVSAGMYTMNVGNLMPGESVDVTYRYTQNLRWNGSSIRFHLPTTIAPRYGNEEAAGLEPHQKPEFAIAGGNRFSMGVKIKGLLATSKSISSPSHEVVVDQQSEYTSVSMADGAASMDRDFILVFDCESDRRDGCFYQEDFEGYAAMASFCPSIPDAGNVGGRSIKILVDCSGSMDGDSIHQAQIALDKILSSLKSDDYFNVTLFGSTYTTWFPKQVQATSGQIDKARKRLMEVRADMGGTELGEALEHVYSLECDQIESHNILLITDGEVWDEHSIVQDAILSEHRIFSVGVGSAVAEEVVRNLAERTGGMFELVSPNEQMAERIHRHFMRISPSPVEQVEVIWPQQAENQFPARVRTAFHEDTLLVYSRFKNAPDGPVVLKMMMSDGTALEQTVHATPFSGTSHSEKEIGLIPRLVAATEVGLLKSEKDKQEVAVKYQLMTDQTNYFLFEERAAEEKSDTLPNLRKVRQNLATGWHGVDSLCERSTGPSEIKMCLRTPSSIQSERPIPAYLRKAGGELNTDPIPAFIRKNVDGDMVEEFNFEEDLFHTPIEAFAIRVIKELEDGRKISGFSLAHLQGFGLPDDYISVLKKHINRGHFPISVIHAFIYWVLVEKMEKQNVPREVRRVVVKSYKTNQLQELAEEIGEQAEAISEEEYMFGED